MHLKNKKYFSSKKEGNVLVSFYFLCFSFQMGKIWLWLSFTIRQFDVFWKLLENMLFGSKTPELSKIFQTLVAFIYLVSLNAFSRIFEKYSSQKNP